MEIPSKICQYRKIKCKFSNEELKAIDFQEHELKSCTQIIECLKCHKTMTRGTYNSEHNTKDNIDCLKSQVEFYKNKYLEFVKLTANKCTCGYVREKNDCTSEDTISDKKHDIDSNTKIFITKKRTRGRPSVK